MIARKIIQLQGNNTGSVLSPVVTIPLPVEGFWRIVALVAEYGSPGAASAPVVRFRVQDSRSVVYAIGQINCGVAAFDGRVGWQKEGQSYVPADVTDNALQPAPSHIFDCARGLSVVLTDALTGGAAGQFNNVLLTLEQLAASDMAAR